MRDFSEIVKELRLSKNLTQSQLAERMWVKKSIISAYETDARPPSLDMLIKYAKEGNYLFINLTAVPYTITSAAPCITAEEA